MSSPSNYILKTLSLEQKQVHFADDILRYVHLKEMFCIFIQRLAEFVPKVLMGSGDYTDLL